MVRCRSDPSWRRISPTSSRRAKICPRCWRSMDSWTRCFTGPSQDASRPVTRNRPRFVCDSFVGSSSPPPPRLCKGPWRRRWFRCWRLTPQRWPRRRKVSARLLVQNRRLCGKVRHSACWRQCAVRAVPARSRSSASSTPSRRPWQPRARRMLAAARAVCSASRPSLHSWAARSSHTRSAPCRFCWQAARMHPVMSRSLAAPRLRQSWRRLAAQGYVSW
mmetsp:Transcript_12776/g.34321  ORF Transcript_12776/g.34321 Transcript_12776/m.34321 type:complete len:219 (+) Transcript_12776:593-1249(+)